MWVTREVSREQLHPPPVDDARERTQGQLRPKLCPQKEVTVAGREDLYQHGEASLTGLSVKSMWSLLYRVIIAMINNSGVLVSCPHSLPPLRFI